MQKITTELRQVAAELLNSGRVDMVLGYTSGDLPYQTVPYIATSREEADNLIFDGFSEKSLSKYLLEESFQGKRAVIFAKGCDYRALSLMVAENRINRDNLYIIGVNCPGMIRRESLERSVSYDLAQVNIEFRDDKLIIDSGHDSAHDSEHDSAHDSGYDSEHDSGYDSVHDSGSENDVKEVSYHELVSPFCLSCEHPVPPKDQVDVQIEQGEPKAFLDNKVYSHEESFTDIGELENMSEEERFEFWERQLNRCRRCYSCRNACPVCSCRVCLFDREDPAYLDKATNQLAQHQFYHVIRAFHVSDRCVGCGECSRVCPENIPLHLLNQKLVNELEKYYGEYTPGIDDLPAPLSQANADDPDPFEKEEK